MRNAYDVAAIREAEQRLMAELPPGALMRRAAAGLASVCAGVLGRVYGARVVVLAGGGDNGGDALHAGALLARRGAAVAAVAAASRTHEEGAAALRAAGGRLTGPDDPDVPAAVAAADLILDGLLGIGGRGGLRAPQAGLAVLLDQARARTGGTPAGGGEGRSRGGARGPLVVAVDLPSGVDAGTGEVAGAAVRADVTVTFGAWKPGLLVDPGASHAGIVELVDIGLAAHLGRAPVAAPQAPDVAALLPRPRADSDKYRRGVVGIVAGSDAFTGAATLAAGGAVRGGAGMVRLVSAPPAADTVRQRWPEVVITVAGGDLPPGDDVGAAGRVQAWVAGPGMGADHAARRRLAAVLATDLPALVDADGLTLAAREPSLLSRSAPTLLTPHAGELARLLGTDRSDVEARRLEHARQAAAEWGATVLLKGSTTVVAPPGGEAPVLVNSAGSSWLATAGTGDVLSGLAGALLAQGLAPWDAALAAAFLHGVAARRAASGRAGLARLGAAEREGAPIGAFDVIRALPEATRTVRAPLP